MTERDSEKFEKVQEKLEKKISPYITVKIPMPEGANKDAFLQLENNSDFIALLENQTRKWLTKK
jgi:hypothetical protein